MVPDRNAFLQPDVQAMPVLRPLSCNSSLVEANTQQDDQGHPEIQASPLPPRASESARATRGVVRIKHCLLMRRENPLVHARPP